MKITGIICEYDPFHNGHRYLLRRAQSDAVVCVMSGNLTQRGGMAIADKYTRAEMAVRNGADLVLELPYPYASASAAFFASAGVSVLASVGAERICFGSECGDVTRIMRAAEIALRMQYEETDPNTGTADGYFAALGEAYHEAYGETLQPSSNDILAIEYGKAILENGYPMEPVAVKRKGDGFRAILADSSSFTSATAVRRLLREEGIDAVTTYVPEESARLLREAISRGDAPVDMGRIEQAVLAFLRLADPRSLSEIAELGNGLEFRLCEAAREVTDLASLFDRVSTKKYTDARLRRAVLYAMTGVTAEDLRAPVGYTTVLAANSVGCGLLSEVRRREGGIPLVTKPADGRAVSPRQFALTCAADALYTLAMPTPRDAGTFVRRGPVII